MKLIIIITMATLICSCTMLTAWKSIPPPGGCEQCHTTAISADWKIAYQAPMLGDERNREAFQTEEYTMRTKIGQPASSLEVRKLQDLRCFECHSSPNSAHKVRSGKFHH